MSYVNMDHAGWVERNIAAGKTLHRTARDKRNATENKGWLAAPNELNQFQRRAFNILGIVGNGIYNAPITWDSIYWHPRMVAVTWRNNLGTFDFTGLTKFVFLCHEARIRGEISPKGFRHVEIHLSERLHDGGMGSRHPNLDEAIASFRSEFPRDHSLNYVVPPSPIATAEPEKP